MRKQWIAYHSHVSGVIEIDEGAEQAIVLKGKSLLSVGVTNVIGEFNALDVVEVRSQKGKPIGKGQSYFSSMDLLKVKGLPSEQSKTYSINQRAEVIHRDNWVTIRE